jgi:hypothetical protein
LLSVRHLPDIINAHWKNDIGGASKATKAAADETIMTAEGYESFSPSLVVDTRQAVVGTRQPLPSGTLVGILVTAIALVVGVATAVMGCGGPADHSARLDLRRRPVRPRRAASIGRVDLWRLGGNGGAHPVSDDRISVRKLVFYAD